MIKKAARKLVIHEHAQYWQKMIECNDFDLHKLRASVLYAQQLLTTYRLRA